MRYLFGFLCVCALGVVPLVGCSETAGDGGGCGGSGTATLTVLPLEIDEQDHGTPLPGVTVCENGTTNCDLSDSTGRAVLQLCVDQETSYTVEKDEYGSQLRADVLTAAGDTVGPFMRVDADLKIQYERVMSPYPQVDTGTVYVLVGQVGGGSIEGATLKLIGATGGTAFYLDEEGKWDPDLPATTSTGQGGFVEVRSGLVEVEIGGTASNCLVVRAWPSDSANTIRLPVRQDYMTVAVVNCD